jgi:hypothetical protein
MTDDAKVLPMSIGEATEAANGLPREIALVVACNALRLAQREDHAIANRNAILVAHCITRRLLAGLELVEGGAA